MYVGLEGTVARRIDLHLSFMEGGRSALKLLSQHKNEKKPVEY